MRDIHRVGRVSAVNKDDHTATVYFDDIEHVSAALPIVKNIPKIKASEGIVITVEPWLPAVGEMVICAFLQNSTDGFILGTYV